MEASHTITLIERIDEAFRAECAANPAYAAKMARGLHRWYAWTRREPSEAVHAWLASLS